MTRVSQQRLDTKLATELFGQFVRIVSKSDRRRTGLLLQSLLTETEQVMLAKRIAVIVFLHEGVSMYRIVRVLKMSISTISEMKHAYTHGKYNDILHVLGKSKAEREAFWKTVEVVIRGGMPSMGRDRWKWLDEVVPRDQLK